MLCKKCGKYHPEFEPCYYDLPHEIIIHYTAEQLARASDEQIANELRRRSIVSLPHPNPSSPDYSLPVLSSKSLTDPRRRVWRKYCLQLLAEADMMPAYY